ncbi:MAG: ubiquinol-cytochrome c reductase cytochrome b subunit [Micromonosporaceae bacterium]|jgi:ubiquinol-cytochrome c reductase cytochrome b subunit|nr:ubiquinol-cytochrome c reductase cytochrome b subunit [Micromonosporaceae bacterium]
MIVRRLVRLLDSRLRLSAPVRRAMAKVFPDHWTFMFGEIALYSFVALVLTGTFLALFFEPSTTDRVYHGSYQPLHGKTISAAYASTVELSFDVRAGLLVRQAHHWAALVFIGAILLHLARIFFTGAFRKPREINWLVGVTMLTLALLNGFTGYSMPDDLLSGTGLRIAYSVVESIPLLGGWLAFLLFGGEFPADQTVPRMFFAHVFLVPAALAGLITLHMLILVRQKHSQFPAPGRNEHNVVGSRLWPSYTLRTLALFAAVLAVTFALGGLFQINPVWIYGPYDPARATSPAQPDWYVAWEEGALRLFPAADFRIFGYLVPSPFFPGVVLGALTFLALYAWPFLEARVTGERTAHQLLDRPRDHPARLGVGVAALLFYSVLVGAAADDVFARLLRVPVTSLVWTFRFLALGLPLAGGMLAYYLARALRAGSAPEFAELTRADLHRGAKDDRVPGDGDGPPAARIEVWQEFGLVWRWRYVEPTGGAKDLELTSNIDYPSEQEAAKAARAAYPGVPIGPGRPPPGLELPAAPATRRLGGPLARVFRLAAWLVVLRAVRRSRSR